jgi:hypothetical protein
LRLDDLQGSSSVQGLPDGLPALVLQVLGQVQLEEVPGSLGLKQG